MTLQSRRWPLVLIAPFVLLILAVTIYPFLYMLAISLFDYNIAKGDPPSFVGLGNFLRIPADPTARETIVFTLMLLVIVLPVEIILGVAIAFLMRDVIGGRFIRSVLLLPMMMPAIVTGLIWRMLFNTDYGPLNYLLSFFGIGKIKWVGQQEMARLSLMIVDVWQWTPFVFLVLYAGLQALPTDLTEAARVDGAGGWALLRYIELPQLMPLVLVVLLVRLIDVLKLFDIIFAITEGGPGSATHTFSFYIYRVGLSYGWDVGYAAALSVVLLAAVTVMVNVLMRALRVRSLLEI